MKDLPHQPQVLPKNGGFQQSYLTTGSYNHQPQQPTNTVPEYQYGHPSMMANSPIEESSAVEGYPPNQHRHVDSYYARQPLPHESAAPLPSLSDYSLPPQSAPPLQPRWGISNQHNSPPPQYATSLPPGSSSSYQYNALPPQSSASHSPSQASSIQGYSQFAVPPPESNPSTQRYQSTDNNQGGQPSVPVGTPPVQGHARYVEATAQPRNKASGGHTGNHYNEQQPPFLASYRPSAPSTDWDHEGISTPVVAYPVQDYHHVHAPVPLIPVDPHATTAPTGQPIHTSLNHEYVQPVPNVYGAPNTRQPMVQQQQPSLPPSTQPLIRQSVVSGDPQVATAKPQQQPAIVSTPSDATKPPRPDGYPTTGQQPPSPEPKCWERYCGVL